MFELILKKIYALVFEAKYVISTLLKSFFKLFVRFPFMQIALLILIIFSFQSVSSFAQNPQLVLSNVWIRAEYLKSCNFSVTSAYMDKNKSVFKTNFFRSGISESNYYILEFPNAGSFNNCSNAIEGHGYFAGTYWRYAGGFLDLETNLFNSISNGVPDGWKSQAEGPLLLGCMIFKRGTVTFTDPLHFTMLTEDQHVINGSFKSGYESFNQKTIVEYTLKDAEGDHSWTSELTWALPLPNTYSCEYPETMVTIFKGMRVAEMRIYSIDLNDFPISALLFHPTNLSDCSLNILVSGISHGTNVIAHDKNGRKVNLVSSDLRYVLPSKSNNNTSFIVIAIVAVIMLCVLAAAARRKN